MVSRAEFLGGVLRLSRLHGRHRRRFRKEGCGGGEPRGPQRNTGETLWVVLVILFVLAYATSGAAQQQPAESAAQSEAKAGTQPETSFRAITPYRALTLD